MILHRPPGMTRREWYVRRHRRYQVLLTLGVVGAVLLHAIHAEAALIASTFTSLVWIWEH